MDTWEPVVTLPLGMDYPPGVRRGTAETIIGILTEARDYLRLVAPFIDEGGMRILGPPIAAATSRGVRVTVLFSKWTSWEQSAVSTLRRDVSSFGDWSNVRLLRARELFPWPHLKVLVVDSITAYVGSANVTGAALGGRNVELGVLLRGAKVHGVIGVLDRIESDNVELV
jgi:phosphatidylserine/phosphatidylglycerophosphate/cardiolipin synthase-like enzyme